MPIPKIFQDFLARAGRRYGEGRAEGDEDGCFVALDQAIVHLTGDLANERVAIWVDLDLAEDVDAGAAERFALAWTSESYLGSRTVMGVDRSVRLALLGRSLDQSALADDGIFLSIEALAREAAEAGDGLAQQRSELAKAPNPAEASEMTFQA